MLDKQIIKIFDNPLGRWLFGVPKGKKIYKITKYSAHYYTGEKTEDGSPIICSGSHFPKKEESFREGLKNWKPIHLCWLFELMGWKIPKYFIGLDSSKSPTSVTDNTDTGTREWEELATSRQGWIPSAYLETQYSHYLYYQNFAFSIPNSTILGIVFTHNKARLLTGGASYDVNIRIIKADGTRGSANKADTGHNWATTKESVTYGSSSDLWSETWAYTDINDADFGVAISNSSYSPNGNSNYSYSYKDSSIRVYYASKIKRIVGTPWS